MDLAQRTQRNPIISPEDVKPSQPGWRVVCVLNPGAFSFNGRIGLLLRVAEQPAIEDDELVAVWRREGKYETLKVNRKELGVDAEDPRLFSYNGQVYLTTISHLRLAWSDNGVDFEVEDSPTLLAETEWESYGIEDPRVSEIDGTYYITYTAVSEAGVAVAMQSTRDWKHFLHHGLILPPHNKDCALFESRVNGKYVCFHRPSGVGGFGGNDIWYAESPDAAHWGNHRCVMRTRPGMWDERRIGAGAAPILTDEGWLEIYHGSDRNARYCLGAVLLDREHPWRVLKRSKAPVMEPVSPYEKEGFFGQVVFTNGHVLRDERILLYYGAADEYVCMAEFSLPDILQSLDES
ncbi:MAG: glycosidase [Lentisphaerae bacterium]|nr:MAG: glycosidase [Lentisphaerota bacterium]